VMWKKKNYALTVDGGKWGGKFLANLICIHGYLTSDRYLMELRFVIGSSRCRTGCLRLPALERGAGGSPHWFSMLMRFARNTRGGMSSTTPFLAKRNR
jgi:hypothetical protein